MSSDQGLREVRNMEEYVKTLRKDLDKRLEELKLQVSDLQQRAAVKVTERPWLALGLAFTAGMALGIALSRSRE